MAAHSHAPQGTVAERAVRWLRSHPVLIVVTIVALLLPKVIQPAVGDSWLPMTTVVIAAIYVMFALGLNVVVGYAGLLDLGYVAFFLIGGYTAGWLMSDFFAPAIGSDGTCTSDAFRCWISDIGGKDGIHAADAGIAAVPGIHVSFWVVIVAAGALAAVLGVFIGAPTLRLKSDYLALVTLGFGEILPQFARNADSIKGFDLTHGTQSISPIDPIDLGWLGWIPGLPDRVGPFDYTSRYYVILALIAVYVVASLRLRGGKLGRSWVAIREDELAASLMGVPLMRAKLWSYAIGAIAGGVAGVFYASSLNTVSVDTYTFQFSVIVLVYVIVGGLGNVWGVILGAAVISWFNYTGLAQMGDTINSWFGTSFDIPRYNFLMLGVLLVLMMLFRRDGILPESRARQARKLEEQLEKVGTEADVPAGVA